MYMCIVHVQCHIFVCNCLATKVYIIENASYKMSVGDHRINKLQ